MEQETNPFREGKVILVDKPFRWTSFEAVKKIKYHIRKKTHQKIKVGHAGTLDPLATGLLICCTGNFTKKINDFQGMNKVYEGTFHLGAVTPTYDLESEPEDFKDLEAVDVSRIKKAAESFTGFIRQVPPIHSAVKKDGKRAYELARKGLEVELEARTVEISSFDIIEVNLPEVAFRVVCSKGTYIRTLANDFGKVLGCGAYLSSLRRTRIGSFSVEDAKDIEEITAWIDNYEGMR